MPSSAEKNYSQTDTITYYYCGVRKKKKIEKDVGSCIFMNLKKYHNKKVQSLTKKEKV